MITKGRKLLGTWEKPYVQGVAKSLDIPLTVVACLHRCMHRTAHKAGRDT